MLGRTVRATALTSRGSKRAPSSSLAIARATVTPSFAPGGERAPPTNACATASLSRMDAFEMKRVSRLLSARRTRIVSGLSGSQHCCTGESARDEPLIGLRVDSVGMHRNFREKVMEEAEQARVPRAEGLLEEGRALRRVLGLLVECTRESVPERQRWLLVELLPKSCTVSQRRPRRTVASTFIASSRKTTCVT
jgi:hypothetical protein